MLTPRTLAPLVGEAVAVTEDDWDAAEPDAEAAVALAEAEAEAADPDAEAEADEPLAEAEAAEAVEAVELVEAVEDEEEAAGLRFSQHNRRKTMQSI